MPETRSATPSRTEKPTTGFVRDLGLMDSTMIVAGSMIGSGIFIVSADIARQVGSAGWLLMRLGGRRACSPSPPRSPTASWRP